MKRWALACSATWMTSASVASGFPKRMLSMIDDPNNTGSCGDRLELQHLNISIQELHKRDWSIPDWWIQQFALSTRTNPVSVYQLHPAWSRRWSGRRNAPARTRQWTYLQWIVNNYFQTLWIIINIKNQAASQKKSPPPDSPTMATVLQGGNVKLNFLKTCWPGLVG